MAPSKASFPRGPHALVIDQSYLVRSFYEAALQSGRRESMPLERCAEFVIRRVMMLIAQRRPMLIFVCVDGDGETHRHRLWELYKDGRERHDAYLQDRRAISKVLSAYNLEIVKSPGWEGDDQVATVVTRLRHAAPDLTIVILSRDKDLFPLLDENTVLWSGRDDEVITAAYVCEKYGLKTTAQFADLLGLVGDKDEAPGVRGIGEASAKDLLQRFGSFEAVMEKAHFYADRAAQAVCADRDRAWLSRELVRLRTDAPAGLAASLERAMVGWSRTDALAARAIAQEHGISIAVYGGTAARLPPAGWLDRWATTSANLTV